MAQGDGAQPLCLVGLTPPNYKPMSASIATSVTPILGVTPLETYALTLLSFDAYHGIREEVLESLEKKKLVTTKDNSGKQILPALTERARQILSIFHR